MGLLLAGWIFVESQARCLEGPSSKLIKNSLNKTKINFNDKKPKVNRRKEQSKKKVKLII